VIKARFGNSAALHKNGQIAALPGEGGVRLWHLPTGRRWGPRSLGLNPTVEFHDHLLHTLDSNHLNQVWRFPEPVTGQVDEIVRWAQTASGLQLDLDGNLREFDARSEKSK